MFNGEDQCLFQLTEFVIRCWRVWEERAQALLSGVIDLWEVEPGLRRECEGGGNLVKGFRLPEGNSC